MPTVLRIGGFRVVILLPPREHGPPHVHVQAAAGEVVIILPSPDERAVIRGVAGLGPAAVTRAYWIVEEHAEYLRNRWREFHGEVENTEE